MFTYIHRRLPVELVQIQRIRRNRISLLHLQKFSLTTSVAHKHLQPLQSPLIHSRKRLYSTIMAPSIPEEQWAQVIEKTGGPIDYKKVSQQNLSFTCSRTDNCYPRSRFKSPDPTKFLSTSNTREFVTQICTQSMVTGHWQQSYP